MEKTGQKLIVLLLSLLIVMAFMPMMSFADDTSNGGSNLTAAQMSSAIEIKAGDTVTLPSEGSQVYKFTATDSNNYGFAIRYENEGNYGMTGYNSEGKLSDADGNLYAATQDSPRYDGYTAYAVCGLNLGETYYVLVESENIDSGKATATFNKIQVSKVKIAGKGTFTDGFNYGIVGNFGIGYTANFKPSFGYGFKGLYYGSQCLYLTYETNTTAKYFIPEKAIGKTIVAKFVNVGAKGKAVQKNKMKISSYNVNLTKNTISVNVKSKIKLDYYFIEVVPLSDGAIGYASYTNTKGAITTDFYGAKSGEKYVIRVYGAKKVKGVYVFTPLVKKNITLK